TAVSRDPYSTMVNRRQLAGLCFVLVGLDRLRGREHCRSGCFRPECKEQGRRPSAVLLSSLELAAGLNVHATRAKRGHFAGDLSTRLHPHQLPDALQFLLVRLRSRGELLGGLIQGRQGHTVKNVAGVPPALSADGHGDMVLARGKAGSYRPTARARTGDS